jgi:hypothetical protein
VTVAAVYEREGETLVRRRFVDAEHSIVLRAANVREERTGVHARVSIGCNGASLAWGTFNVEKDEERVRLANSAYGHLNGLAASYPKAYLKHDLDTFCAGLWDEQLAVFAPEPMAGSAESAARRCSCSEAARALPGRDHPVRPAGARQELHDAADGRVGGRRPPARCGRCPSRCRCCSSTSSGRRPRWRTGWAT